MNDRQAFSSEIQFLLAQDGGSEIGFLMIELDDRSSIISRYFQALIHLTYKKFQKKNYVYGKKKQNS